jgi:hypothetical protein
MINSISSDFKYTRPDDSSPIFQSTSDIKDFGKVHAPDFSKNAPGSTGDSGINLGRLADAGAAAFEAYNKVGGGPLGIAAAVVTGVSRLFGFGRKKKKNKTNQGGTQNPGLIGLVLKTLQGDQKIK